MSRVLSYSNKYPKYSTESLNTAPNLYKITHHASSDLTNQLQTAATPVHRHPSSSHPAPAAIGRNAWVEQLQIPTETLANILIEGSFSMDRQQITLFLIGCYKEWYLLLL